MVILKMNDVERRLPIGFSAHVLFTTIEVGEDHKDMRFEFRLKLKLENHFQHDTAALALQCMKENVSLKAMKTLISCCIGC